MEIFNSALARQPTFLVLAPIDSWDSIWAQADLGPEVYSDNGLLLGGQRFGLDSHLGFQEGRGLDLGNLLSLFQPVVNQFISRRPPPSPPALPTSALSQSRPPQTFASFPEEDGQPNGQAVSGPVMPTLIQPPVQPPDAASGAWIDPNGSTMTTSNQTDKRYRAQSCQL